MNTYRIKVKQVYIETVFAEAESKEDKNILKATKEHIVSLKK